MNTKISDDVRARLEAASAVSDRTLSHEIEYRLEKSLDDEDNSRIQEFALGDDDTRDLAETFQLVFAAVSNFALMDKGAVKSVAPADLAKLPRTNWKNDAPTRAAIRVATETVLDVLFEAYPLPDLGEGTPDAQRAAALKGTAGFAARLFANRLTDNPHFPKFLQMYAELHGKAEDAKDFLPKSNRNEGS